MNWESWDTFWKMGGYGLYVWGSFGMTLVCVAGDIWLQRRHRRQTLLMLKRMKQWASTPEGETQ
jgi:heme exporter protein D